MYNAIMGYETAILNNAQTSKIIPLITQWLNVSERRAKRLVDKGRVKQNGEVVQRKGEIVSGTIEVLIFEPTIEEIIVPVLDEQDFAIFNKPAGMLSHPNGFDSPSTVLDHAKSLFGNDANITHRLDALTSGLIVIAKHRKSEIEFKNMFEARSVKKTYFAQLRGILEQERTVNASLKQESFGEVRKKMRVSSDGKECITHFRPIKFYTNSTLVEVAPQTGRLHQIRAHAEFMNHAILGDPLYGVSSEIAKQYLEKEASLRDLVPHTRANRLCLHAKSLEFNYLGKNFSISCDCSFDAHI